MRHMLFRQKAMPDVPVPRNDLTKLILASYKDTKKANMGTTVIALAQESFPKTMGMEMKELRVAPISKGKSKLAGKVRLFFLIPLESGIICEPMACKATGFTAFVTIQRPLLSCNPPCKHSRMFPSFLDPLHLEQGRDIHCLHDGCMITLNVAVAAESEAAGSKFYVLRSLVPRNWKKKFIVDDSETPSKHLLIVLLMLIKCHGDKLSEGETLPTLCTCLISLG